MLNVCAACRSGTCRLSQRPLTQRSIRQTASLQENSVSELWRKKPIMIEAWHFMGESIDAPEWINPTWWFEEIVPITTVGRSTASHFARSNRRGSPFLLIPTGEGAMRANLGDWIIKGIKGEVYPCKPDIFEANYERAPSKPVAGEPKGDA